MERICPKCQKPQEASAFYSGHAQCKDCVKARSRRHRAENIERVREYDRARASLPHRIALRRQIFENYKAEQPNRRKAHVAVGNALRDKRLHKAPCSFCGATEALEAHHHDYSKPLDVTWLCKPCHRRFHALERMATYRQEDAA